MPNRCDRTRSHNLSSAAPLTCHFTTSSQSILDGYKSHNEKTTTSRVLFGSSSSSTFSRARWREKEHSESPRSRVIAIKRTSNRTVRPAVFKMGTMTMHRDATATHVRLLLLLPLLHRRQRGDARFRAEVIDKFNLRRSNAAG